MSSDVAISVRDLAKQYRIGAIAGARFSYKTIRETMLEGIRNIGVPGLRRRRGGGEERTIWALKGISFDVREGERVGIVGRNGAGKTTTLKLLARITEPTRGEAFVYGRLGALLEIETGFHPELTGRENIFLKAAVLGMKRSEIKRRFDEIVAFAEVERFLDTPVKRYSTGMYTRLAFSVTAHLDPDILVVDEVLAVGDARFQRKCIGKMEEVGGTGRTVLFVSHNMPLVARLCPRVILLDSGELIADGPAGEVIRTYLEAGYGSAAEREWESPDTAPGDDAVRLKSVRVLSSGKKVADEFVEIVDPVEIQVEYWNLTTTRRPSVNIHLYNEEGIVVFVSNDFNNREWHATPRSPGIVRSTCKIPGNFLAEGRFFALVAVSSYDPVTVHAEVRDAVSFQVADHTTGEGVRGEYTGHWPGVVRPMLDWDVEFEPVAQLEGLARRSAPADLR